MNQTSPAGPLVACSGSPSAASNTSSLSITEQRKAYIAFSVKYYETPSLFVAAKRDGGVSVVDAVTGAVLAEVFGIEADILTDRQTGRPIVIPTGLSHFTPEGRRVS